MTCKVKYEGSHVKGRGEDTQGAVPVSYPWWGRLCYEIPGPTFYNYLYNPAEASQPF